MFNEDFDQCTVAELNFVLNFSENKNLDLFLGGTQFRKETLEFVKFLETHPLVENHSKDIDAMAMLL